MLLDDTALDFLEGLDMPYCKIASFENSDIPLIQYVPNVLGKSAKACIECGTPVSWDILCAPIKKRKNERLIYIL